LSRFSLTLTAVGVFSFLTVLGVSWATRTPLTHPEARTAIATAGSVGGRRTLAGPDIPAQALSSLQSAPAAPGAAAPASALLSSVAVSKLAAVAVGTDPAARAAAITVLGAAPRLEGLSILQTVLKAGDTAVDRPLALRALRRLAIEQGDADGGIRDVLRAGIYDGTGDETAVRQDQAALDEIEGALALADAAAASRGPLAAP
jgi:hypothetical protein